ncbi:MarR family winged helix-turn-helix transcriptional regulator [Kitasatospora purpeofusca]|uniref:MarR family winged helix-turn-helix transcriptional regulator n=1 Tax=Kitasatospora purpeofusca TaxID=67352 RepID=UPI0035DDDF81
MTSQDEAPQAPQASKAKQAPQAPQAPPDEHADLWLTPAELDSWMSVVRLITRLPWAIDTQLQRDADLSMVEYMTLAVLSESPGRTLRMSTLAEHTSTSLSRLSHLVKRLEGRGYVRREPDPDDGRFTNAVLLPAGMGKLEEAAPGHVAHVRHLVVDNLSGERLRRLGRDAEHILGRIDSPAR